MYWPRLKLTPQERVYSSLYPEPGQPPAVKRRFYQGHLELSQTNRNPIWNFQITRRVRVFGLTMVGDVHQFRIQLQDSAGEEYFANPIIASNVFQGWSQSGLQAGAIESLNTAEKTGQMSYICPFIINPNIVLTPNQTLLIKGTEVTPWADQAYRVDFVIHVWEFEGYTKLLKSSRESQSNK